MQPFIGRAAKAGAEFLFTPDRGSFEQRIAAMRARVEGATGVDSGGDASRAVDDASRALDDAVKAVDDASATVNASIQSPKPPR